jgi:hypothetical protein
MGNRYSRFREFSHRLCGDVMPVTQYRTKKNLGTNYQRSLDDMTSLFQDLTMYKGNRWPVDLKLAEFQLNRNDGRFYFKMTDAFPLSYDMDDFQVELWVGPLP